MVRKQRVVVLLLAQLVLVVFGSYVAQAATLTTRQRVMFERAMARYSRVLASTAAGQAVAQMRGEESQLAPCVSQLKAAYRHGDRISTWIDAILGEGVHDTGEPWAASAEIPLDQTVSPRAYIAELRRATHINVCAVIDKWGNASFAWADRPVAIFSLLAGYLTGSPVAAVGATHWARTFSGWGFSARTTKRLIAEFNAGLSRYSALNATVGRQYIGWLQKVGIYLVMRPADRAAINFGRY